MCLYSLVGSFKCVRKMVHIYRWLASFHDKTTVRSLRFFSFFSKGGREVGGGGGDVVIYAWDTGEVSSVELTPRATNTHEKGTHPVFFCL